MFTTTILFIILGVLAVILLGLIIALIVVSSKNKRKDANVAPPVMAPPQPVNQGPVTPIQPKPIPEPRPVAPPIDPPVIVDPLKQDFEEKTVVLNNAQNSLSLTIELSMVDNPSARFRANIPDGGRIVVGRNAQNSDIALVNDSSVSGKHCEFYRQGVGVYVKDLGSTNGTFIGEERISSGVSVPDATVLTIGRSAYKISYIWI